MHLHGPTCRQPQSRPLPQRSRRPPPPPPPTGPLPPLQPPPPATVLYSPLRAQRSSPGSLPFACAAASRPASSASGPSRPDGPSWALLRISGDGACMFRALVQGAQIATRGAEGELLGLGGVYSCRGAGFGDTRAVTAALGCVCSRTAALLAFWGQGRAGQGSPWCAM